MDDLAVMHVMQVLTIANDSAPFQDACAGCHACGVCVALTSGSERVGRHRALTCGSERVGRPRMLFPRGRLWL